MPSLLKNNQKKKKKKTLAVVMVSGLIASQKYIRHKLMALKKPQGWRMLKKWKLNVDYM